MTRIGIWLASTITVVVLLFGYHTSTNSPSSTTATGSSLAAPAPAATGASPPAQAPAATASPTPTAPATAAAAAKTYTGEVAQTRWGPVQVAITVADGRITDVAVPQYPDNNGRDQEINAYALPQLIQETTDQQSARIDMVSGATVTSGGYLQSLQSALDQAGL